MIEILAGIGGTILGVAAVFLAVYLIGRLANRSRERKKAECGCRKLKCYYSDELIKCSSKPGVEKMWRIPEQPPFDGRPIVWKPNKPLSDKEDQFGRLTKSEGKGK